MSRSYRKPYAAHCGPDISAKRDKQMAARALRRKQNQWLRTTVDFEDALVPHRYECHHNDVWCWVRDGKQQLLRPSNYTWTHYHLVHQGLFTWQWEGGPERELESYGVWPPDEYVQYTRK